MKKLATLALSLLCISSAFATDYYVDGVNGNDANPGTSADQAWKTLSLATTNSPFTFNAGDRLFIKAGATYTNQQLVIDECKATPENPMIVTSYGDGHKPIINLGTIVKKAVDERLASLYIKNSCGIEISNLEVRNYPNQDSLRMDKRQKYGAYIYGNNAGELKHIVLKDITFRHVKGYIEASDETAGSGVFWYCDGTTPTYFNGLEIANCEFYNVDRVGITGNNDAKRKEKWYNNINVHIHHNFLHNIGGQAITIKGCDGALCEYNRVDSCGVRDRGVGIWAYKADNSVFQYNIVSNAIGRTDAQGFDSDWNTTNTIFQYNMSVHNEGGFMIVCIPGELAPKDDITHTWNAGNKGTTIRYNLSVNDGYRERQGTTKAYFSPTFHITGATRWVEVYGNTLIMLAKEEAKCDNNFVTFMNWSKRTPSDTYFYNNIFYAGQGVRADFDKHKVGQFIRTSKRTAFSNNAYIGEFNTLPTSAAAMFPGDNTDYSDSIISYDQSAQVLGLDVPVFQDPEALENFSITGLNYEEALAKAVAFKLLPESALCTAGKTNFLDGFYEGISKIQLDYYGLTGFDGYKPLSTTDYLQNNFPGMNGKLVDFFGNTVDDSQKMSIGFDNSQAATGFAQVRVPELHLYPTYASDHVVVPSLTGKAYVVNAAGGLMNVVEGHDNDVTVDVSHLTPGIYFVRTAQGTGKFIKE